MQMTENEDFSCKYRIMHIGDRQVQIQKFLETSNWRSGGG